MRYAIVIEKAENNYSAYAPDPPGCVATGETVVKVEREMYDAIRFTLYRMREDGMTLPEPTAIVDYVEARDITDQIALLDQKAFGGRRPRGPMILWRGSA